MAAHDTWAVLLDDRVVDSKQKDFMLRHEMHKRKYVGANPAQFADHTAVSRETLDRVVLLVRPSSLPIDSDELKPPALHGGGVRVLHMTG